MGVWGPVRPPHPPKEVFGGASSLQTTLSKQSLRYAVFPRFARKNRTQMVVKYHAAGILSLTKGAGRNWFKYWSLPNSCNCGLQAPGLCDIAEVQLDLAHTNGHLILQQGWGMWGKRALVEVRPVGAVQIL